MKFAKYSTSIYFDYLLINKLHVGIGPNLYYIHSIYQTNYSNSKSTLSINQSVYGLSGIINYLINNFSISLVFNKGINYLTPSKAFESRVFKPIDSFCFSLGYNLSISKQ
jgi:hypothetical protein